MKKMNGLLIFCLALLPLTAASETYKCRAPDGGISYAGQVSLTPGVRCEALFVRKQPVSLPDTAVAPASGQPATDAAKPAPQKSAADKELEAKRKKAEADEAKKKADKAAEDKLAEQKLKEDNCNAAQANLRIYQVGGRIGKIDEKGNRVYLDDDEIKQKTEQAQQEVNRWCGS